MKIFVSYSRRDAGDIARKIDESLHEDHDVFTDVEDIQIGAVWTKTIENNISSCDLFVVVITPSSLKSLEIEKEVLQAQEENKYIIPCIHRDVNYQNIKWGLDKIQGIEFDDKYELSRKLNSKISIIFEKQAHSNKDNNSNERYSPQQSTHNRIPLKIIILSIVGAVLVVGIVLALIVFPGTFLQKEDPNTSAPPAPVLTNTNNPPIAIDDSVTTSLNQPVNIQLLASDKDPNSLLTASIVSPPTNGFLNEINQKTGIVTYTPNDGFTGTDNFTFKVNDGIVDSIESGKVSITINNNSLIKS